MKKGNFCIINLKRRSGIWLFLPFLLSLCFFYDTAFCQQEVVQKPALPRTVSRTGPAEGKDTVTAGSEAPGQPSTIPSKIAAQRDPTKIPREIEARLEEAEPPELRVTGIMQIKGRKIAVVELNLEDFEGTVVLEPGMNVSMPKPNREESESGRWMTYFTVKQISRAGIVIVMENGEMVWFPVMSEADYD